MGGVGSVARRFSKASNNSLSEIKIIEFLLLVGIQDGAKSFISSLICPIKKRGIKQFMEDNYLANLKINDYAVLTGRSVSTFTREFKRLYGTTPNKWLINKRISKAHDLLNNTNMNVTQPHGFKISSIKHEIDYI